MSPTLSELLDSRTRYQSGDTFLIFEHQPVLGLADGFTETWTWGEFDHAVRQTGRWLVSQGVGKGDVVNLHLPNCPGFVILWFAIARIGAVMMPTNVLGSASEMTWLLSHSGSVLSITNQHHAQMIRDLQGELSSLRNVAVWETTLPTRETDLFRTIATCSVSLPDHAVSGADLAAIMYTSGTTAKPKGVMVTHANYLKAGQTVADALSLKSRDRHYVVLPLFHGNAQYYSFMSALVVGASVVLMDRFSASRYFDRCRVHACTVASLFAAPMRMILGQEENPEHRDNKLRAVIFAQSLSEAQLDQWNRRFNAPLAQLWGMTETMGPPLMNPWDGERRNQTIGLPIGGYDVRLVDDSGTEVTPGHQGEIVVAGVPGETIMSGYYRNPEATNDTIRSGWLYTGDNATRDELGYFSFVDRIKDMIKRSGENVSAGEVEAVVQTHPAVFECVVVGVPDDIRDEEIVAVVVLKPGASAKEAEIIDHCAGALASFRVPGRVVFEDELPRTSVGKIQKHLVRAALIR